MSVIKRIYWWLWRLFHKKQIGWKVEYRVGYFDKNAIIKIYKED